MAPIAGFLLRRGAVPIAKLTLFRRPSDGQALAGFLLKRLDLFSGHYVKVQSLAYRSFFVIRSAFMPVTVMLSCPDADRTAMSLISVTLSQDFIKCLDQDLDVEPKAPIVDIPQIQLHAFRDVFDRWRCSPCAITLGPSCHPGLDVMAKGVVAQNVFEVIVVGQRVRSWPDQ